MRETTYWENSDDIVFKTKTQYTSIIDMLDNESEIDKKDSEYQRYISMAIRELEKKDSEYQRYISMAITEAQTACMWAVKALNVK